MSEKRVPEIIEAGGGVLGWIPFDPENKRLPETIFTDHGTLVWVPTFNNDAPPATLINIGTLIGKIFWIHSRVVINEIFASVKEKIEELEAKDPDLEIQMFINSYLPILLEKCMQDAARQALREIQAIVAAKAEMNYQPQRTKLLESVAKEAQQASLDRFALTNLYAPLKRGERRRTKDTLEQELTAVSHAFFDEEERIKGAIGEILKENGAAVTPRAIARKLKIGKENPQRDLDSGVKRVEAILKKLRPSQTPKQTIDAFVEEIASSKKSKKEKSRGKIK